MIVKKMK